MIDSYRFMQSKLSDLVDNLSEINKKECVFSKILYEHAQKVWEVFEIKNLGE